MARGGRGGGGSRGGGSRGGGHSGSSRRSGGGFGGSRGGSRGGGYGGGGSRHYGPGPGHHGPEHHYHHEPSHHHYHYHGSRRGGSLAGSIVAMTLFIIILSFVLLQNTCSFALAGCSGAFGGVSSTKNREKLDRNLVNLTEWYTDELGWIEYENDLISGMEDFYEDTGIQPYLYLVDWNGTISENEMHQFAEEAYEQFFTDEGHILVCYFSCAGDSIDYVGGEPYLLCGKATEVIMDEEAQKIFWSEELNNYENDNLYFEEYWGETFSDAGQRIMAAPVPWTTVAIVVVVVIGVIVVVIIIRNITKARIAQKNKEQEDLERMLDKPLETFGDDVVEDLKNKYDAADKQ